MISPVGALVVVALAGVAAQAPPSGDDVGAGSPAPSPAAEPVAADDVAPPSAVAAAPEPILESVAFEGRTYFREETLKTFLRHPVPGPLDPAQLQDDADEIAARFKDRGYLQARCTVRIDDGPTPQAKRATFVIDAGLRAELREVHVVGERLVAEKDLVAGFFSRPPEPLGALTRAGFFHRPYLDQDAQRLVANYYQRGFLEARVVGTRATASSDLQGIAVWMDVVEGPLYELAGVTFEGDLPPDATPEQLRAGVGVPDGGVADLVRIQKDVDALLNPLREQGYAFARVEQIVEVRAAPSNDPERRGVALVYRFLKGAAAKIGHVRVVGNQGTMEHVIRRDVTVVEGDTYRHSALAETQRRLQGTGFFASVAVRPVATPLPDVVDVEVAVTEQPTWIFSPAPFWAGEREGFVFIVVAADRNLFGSGLTGSFVGQFSGLRQFFDVSLTEPRLLASRVATTIEVHRRDTRYVNFHVASEVGGGLRATVPIWWGEATSEDAWLVDHLRRFAISGGLVVEYGGAKFADDDQSGVVETREVLVDPALFPQNVLRDVVDVSARYDSRDSALFPKNGVFVQAGASYAGPYTLSGVSFLDTSGDLRLFWTPFWNITWKSNTSVGYVFDPHGGVVPVTDRAFLGGLGSVRGYAIRSLSPEKLVQRLDGELVSVPIGGVFRFVQNVELEFPLWPSVPFLRGFVFLDAGDAFAEDEPWFAIPPSARGARALPLGLFWSTGGGLLIETAVLPFRFEWSLPLTRRAEDPERGVPGDPPVDFFIGVGSAF